MKPLYTVKEAKSSLEANRLRVIMLLREKEEHFEIEAQLPAREIAAILPREIIVGLNRNPSPRVFEIMNELLSKLAVGRDVRIWEYGDRTYCSFLKWGSVRFLEEPPTELSRLV